MYIFNKILFTSKVLLVVFFIYIAFIFYKKYKEYQNYEENSEEILNEESSKITTIHNDIGEMEEELKRLEKIQELKNEELERLQKIDSLKKEIKKRKEEEQK